MFLVAVTSWIASCLFCKRPPSQTFFVLPMYRTWKESQNMFPCLLFSSVISLVSFLSRRTYFPNHKTKVSESVWINLLLFQTQFFDLIQLDALPVAIWKPIYSLGQCPGNLRRARFPHYFPDRNFKNQCWKQKKSESKNVVVDTLNKLGFIILNSDSYHQTVVRLKSRDNHKAL